MGTNFYAMPSTTEHARRCRWLTLIGAVAFIVCGLAPRGAGAQSPAPTPVPIAASPLQASYKYAGSIPVPFAPSFMATDANGRLFITGHNTGSDQLTLAFVVDLPTVDFSPRSFDSARFDPGRGYSGVAVDTMGGVYVTGDTGFPESNFIKKYTGKPLALDEKFGARGVIKGLSLRSLGCTVHNGKLIVAISWGILNVFNADTGEFEYLIPGDRRSKILDIHIEPNAQQIFAVGDGSIFWWSNGSLENPTAYQFRQLTPKVPWDEAPTVGITFHPMLSAVFFANRNPAQIKSLTSSGESIQMSKADNPNLASVCDIAFSPDYNVMYVSDPTRRAIHYSVLTSAVSPSLPKGGLVGQPLAPMPKEMEEPRASLVTRQIQKNWYTDYTRLALDAMAQSKKMGIYFRNERTTACAELEAGLMAGPALFQAFPDVLWMKIDVDTQSDVAKQFNVLKVPSVILINEIGEKLATLTRDINEQEIRRSLSGGR